MKLAVISCCYEQPRLAWRLQESCAAVKLPLIMCSARELNGKWNGDMRVGKLKAVWEWLPAIADEGYTHVLWADGFDSFLLQPSITSIFYALSMLNYPPLVLSAEKNCWPDPSVRSLYPKTESEYKYINAGTWIGHVGYLRNVIGKMLAKWPTGDNDQPIWTEAFLNGDLPGAVIDTERFIFQTMWGTELHEISPVASVIHFNGGDWRSNPTRIDEAWDKFKP